MDIHVFKTGVTTSEAVSKVSSLLTAERAIADWNFDLEDCDNILRVVGDLPASKIERMLSRQGIYCQELSY